MTPYLIILVLTVLFLLPVALAWHKFAPWVPTRKNDMNRIFELANLKPGEVFYDLGCGDGRLVVQASKQYQSRSVGFEVALPLYVVSRIRVLLSGSKNVQIKWRNFFKENFNTADVIYLFGTADTLGEDFQNKLKKETKPGTRVISYAFRIGNLTPDQINKPSTEHLPIYVYRF
jgi:cyclopropane fatty-acyl-phospholipid synthase-like methyltransferase